MGKKKQLLAQLNAAQFENEMLRREVEELKGSISDLELKAKTLEDKNTQQLIEHQQAMRLYLRNSERLSVELSSVKNGAHYLKKQVALVEQLKSNNHANYNQAVDVLMSRLSTMLAGINTGEEAKVK